MKWRIHMKWFRMSMPTEPRNSGEVSSMNGNRLSRVQYAPCAPHEMRMHRNGRRSITRSATFMPTLILIAHVRTFFVTLVYSSTISAR